MHLSVDNELVSNCTNDIKKNLNDFSDEISGIKSIIKSIEDNWKGKDADYFIDKINPFIDEIINVFDIVGTNSQILSDYITATNAIEQDFTNKTIDLR